jgi:hypothetical protein
MKRLMDRWLPLARVCHPYPLVRFGVIILRASRKDCPGRLVSFWVDGQTGDKTPVYLPAPRGTLECLVGNLLLGDTEELA